LAVACAELTNWFGVSFVVAEENWSL